MSDSHRKLYSKKGTGTVPKIKYGNNTSLFNQEESNHVSNNLVCNAGDINISASSPTQHLNINCYI